MLFFHVCALVGFFSFILYISGANVYQLLDIPSLLALIVICVPIIAACGQGKHIVTAFSILRKKETNATLETLKNSSDALKFLMLIPLICGFCIASVGVIGIICNLENPAALASSLLLAFLPLLYVALFILIILPFYSRLIILQNKAFGLEY